MKKYKVSSTKKNLLINIVDFFGNIIFFIPNLLIKKSIKEKNIKNILITRLDNIGDMVMTTSFIKNVKYNFPNSKITILCRPCQKSIINNFNYIDKIITYDAFWFGGKDGIIILFKLIHKYFNKYDLSFELHGEIISNFTIFLLSKYRVGFGIRGGNFLLNKSIFYNWNEGVNIVEHQNKLLKKINLKIKYIKLELFIDKNIDSINKEKNKKNIIIHTGVSVKSREYPILKWIKLINKLKNIYNVLIIDTDMKKLNIFKNKGFKTYTPNSINELVKIIYDFDLLIGLESLSSHIGAATGTKTLSIYSASTPEGLMYPYGKYVTIIRDNQCDKINCGLSECCYGYPSNCMNNITTEVIIKKVNKLLS